MTLVTQSGQIGTLITVNNLDGVATQVLLPAASVSSSTGVDQSTLIGALTETAPATDTASSGLNGRLQRIAQRLTTWIGALVTNSGTVGVVNYLYDAATGLAVSMTDPVLTYESNSYANILANGTTTPKSGAGTLVRIIICTKGASSNTLSLFDNTAASGASLGIYDTTGGTLSLNVGLAFGTGLTAVLATGTAANVTLVYR